MLVQTLAKAPSPSSRRRPLSSFAKTMSCVASRLPSLAATPRCALALARVLREDVLRLRRQHHQIRTPATAAAAAHGMPTARPTLSAVLAPRAAAAAHICQLRIAPYLKKHMSVQIWHVKRCLQERQQMQSGLCCLL